MRVQCDSCEQCRKNKNNLGKHDSKLSPESPYSILHIASISLCVIFAIQTAKVRKGNNSFQPNTEQRAMMMMDSSTAHSWAMMHPFSIVHKVNVQIYTDSGVMYENGQSLRHYARVCSISRLHLSSKKLADNTKGHLKYLKTINYRETFFFSFSGSKAWIFVRDKIIYLHLSSL